MLDLTEFWFSLGENMAAMQTGTSERAMPSSLLWMVSMINLVVATKYLLQQDVTNPRWKNKIETEKKTQILKTH